MFQNSVKLIVREIENKVNRELIQEGKRTYQIFKTVETNENNSNKFHYDRLKSYYRYKLF